MNNEQYPKLTHIRVHFRGTAPRKRKVEFQSEEITVIDGHTKLTEARAAFYSDEAIKIIKDKKYKNVSRCEIVVNFGWDKGHDIRSMVLLPEQNLPFEFEG